MANTKKNKKVVKKAPVQEPEQPKGVKHHDGADFFHHKHIINFLTETDLYKFTQQQFVWGFSQ